MTILTTEKLRFEQQKKDNVNKRKRKFSNRSINSFLQQTARHMFLDCGLTIKIVCVLFRLELSEIFRLYIAAFPCLINWVSNFDGKVSRISFASKTARVRMGFKTRF